MLEIQCVLRMPPPPPFFLCVKQPKVHSDWASHNGTCYHLSNTGEIKLCSVYTSKQIFLSKFPSAFLLTSFGQTHWGTRCNPFLPHCQSSCLACFRFTRQLMNESALASSFPRNNKFTWSLCVADQSKNCILKAEMWSEDSVSPIKHKLSILTSVSWF